MNDLVSLSGIILESILGVACHCEVAGGQKFFSKFFSQFPPRTGNCFEHMVESSLVCFLQRLWPQAKIRNGKVSTDLLALLVCLPDFPARKPDVGC